SRAHPQRTPVRCGEPAIPTARARRHPVRRAGVRGAEMTVRAVVIDLDGVLYVEDEPVPGAADAVASLRARGLALRFATNTTSRPRRRILERLHRLGFDVAPGELITPAALAVRRCAD